jgi:hypothetical protein
MSSFFFAHAISPRGPPVKAAERPFQLFGHSVDDDRTCRCPGCGFSHPIAPVRSRHSWPNRIEHDWRCDACDHEWMTVIAMRSPAVVEVVVGCVKPGAGPSAVSSVAAMVQTIAIAIPLLLIAAGSAFASDASDRSPTTEERRVMSVQLKSDGFSPCSEVVLSGSTWACRSVDSSGVSYMLRLSNMDFAIISRRPLP